MKHQKTKRIIVLGRINTTLTMNVDDIPKPKEQVTAKNVLVTPGGKGSNQAVAASRLGGKVSFVTCLGTDDFGKRLLSFLKAEGIDTGLIKFSKNTPAGMAIVILDKNSENTIISIPGSERELLAEDIKKIRFTDNDIAVSQLALPKEVVLAYLKRAKSGGATTILNLAPRAKYDTTAFKFADYLIPNESEAAFFAGSAKMSQDPPKALKYARKIRSRPGQVVIVTLGGNGSIALAGKEIIRIPGIKVKAVDTQAAGDTFVGAFATAISENKGLRGALEFANKAAAICVQRHGAASSIPARKDVDKT